LNGTGLTSALFGEGSPVTLVSGQSYYFRCQAVDLLGNLEPYPSGNGDLSLTVGDEYVFLPLVRK
jgi:hypothetical protein